MVGLGDGVEGVGLGIGAKVGIGPGVSVQLLGSGETPLPEV
jgi:hypothetical protein